MEEFRKSFRLDYSGPIRSDCCSHSIYTAVEKVTVQEMCDYILTTNQWGYIGINRPGTIFGSPCVEYSNGKYVDENRNEIQFKFPEKYANAIVTRVDWDGGWSRGDWLFTIVRQ